MKKLAALAALGCAIPVTAFAAPGMGGEVYGATVDAGETEFEARYGALGGGPDDGEDVLKLEAAHAFTDRLRIGIVGEIEKEPGDKRRAEAVAIEAIYALGNAGGIDIAVYGEYEVALHGTDKVETKLLLQRKTGPFDLRLNLIAEKELADGAPVELGYAASADVEAVGEVRLGLQAYGELGTFKHFAPRAEHFIGPVAKFEIEGLGPEVGVQLGYLLALGKARDDTDGQFKLAFELEF